MQGTYSYVGLLLEAVVLGLLHSTAKSCGEKTKMRMKSELERGG